MKSNSIEWLIILTIIIENSIASVFIIKRSKNISSNNQKNNTGVETITNYDLATTLVALLLLAIFIVVLFVVIKPGVVVSAIIVSVMLFATVNGESDAFKKYEILDSLIRLTDRKRIRIYSLM